VGLFDKLLRGADKAYDVKADVEFGLFRDRRYDAAERLAAGGDPGTAIVTGIRGRFNGDTTELVYRLEWQDGTGAVLYGAGAPVALRIGSSVLIRADGGAAVLDADRMAGVPTAPRDPGRKKRKVPDVGVDDQAVDMRVLRRLKKWAPERATVAAWQQGTVLGMPADNWAITLTRADGTQAVSGRDNIPPYARWFVHPGSDVPVTVDPGDPTKAQVDWPLLAEERAGGSWDDAPPEGSVAAAVLDGPQ
jgi:hypothetical protein